MHDSYFGAIGMKILAGRAFDSRDRPGHPPVVIVNATLASQRWPGESPIGRQLRVGNDRQRVEVIGVVPDSRYDDLAEQPIPFVYFPLGQRYAPAITVIARTSARDLPGTQIIMTQLFGLNPRLAVNGVMTVEDLRGLYLFLPRTIAITTTVLAALTLALAILGLYSTVFYSVSQRQIEMGIRVALGAEPSDIVKTVLRGTGGFAALGAGLGLLGGLALLPLAASVLYQDRPGGTDGDRDRGRGQPGDRPGNRLQRGQAVDAPDVNRSASQVSAPIQRPSHKLPAGNSASEMAMKRPAPRSGVRRPSAPRAESLSRVSPASPSSAGM